MTFFESSSRSSLFVEHDLFPKTGTHFSGSCSSRALFCNWHIARSRKYSAWPISKDNRTAIPGRHRIGAGLRPRVCSLWYLAPAEVVAVGSRLMRIVRIAWGAVIAVLLTVALLVSLDAACFSASADDKDTCE